MPRRKSSIWEHCELIENNIGSSRVKCNYCLKQYGYKSATRLEEHMTTCEQCPSDIRQKYTKKIKETPMSRVSPLSGPAPSSAPAESVSSNASTTNQSTDSATTSDNLQHKISEEKINTALARAVYATNLPLSLFESPYWKSAVAAIIPNYSPPNKYTMSNSLLNAEYVRLKEETDRKIQKASNLGLVTDGWTNIRSQGVVNFLVTTPKPIFLKCVYPGTNSQTAEYIKREIGKVLEEIGVTKFSCIITDNASVMKAAWRLVEAEYPHIDCVGCAAHAIYLICKDIMTLNCFKTLFKNSKKIITQIKKSHTLLALFEQKQKDQHDSQPKTLKVPSSTRWAGAQLTFESLIENLEALQALAISREANIKPNTKKFLISDETWNNIKCTKKLLTPIAAYIAKIESDDSVLSDVLDAFIMIKNSIVRLENSEFLTTETKEEILGICDSRKSFCLKPIHLAAYLLDPMYHPAVNNNAVSLDDNQYHAATHFISKVADVLSIDNSLVFQNLAEYRSQSQFWSNELLWKPVSKPENAFSKTSKFHPRDWWRGLCQSKPLSSIAVRILSNPPSSAASERNWSLVGRTHTKDRNRLTIDRLNKLIFVNWNLKIVHSNEKEPIYQETDEVYDDASDSDIEL